jgi:hypothetical protein
MTKYLLGYVGLSVVEAPLKVGIYKYQGFRYKSREARSETVEMWQLS